jgi:MipA family protein
MRLMAGFCVVGLGGGFGGDALAFQTSPTKYFDKDRDEIGSGDVYGAGTSLAEISIAQTDIVMNTTTASRQQPGEDRLIPSTRDQSRQRDYFNLGAGIINVPSYSGSNKNIIAPAIVLRGRISGFAFSTRGTNLSVDLIREARGARVDIKFGPYINYRTERSGNIGDVQVRALGKLDRTIELGGWMGISKTGVLTSKHDQIGLRVSVLKDVMGRHRSTIISPSIDYGTPLSKTTYLGISASTSFVGKKFGRYYFDINAAGSAASGLAAYTSAGQKSGWTKYALGIAAAKSLSGDLRKGWAVVAGLQYGRLLGRYAQSPIVRVAGRAGQWQGGVGVGYSF